MKQTAIDDYYSDYDNLSDEQIVAYARTGDDQAQEFLIY